MRTYHEGSNVPLKAKPEDILDNPVIIYVNKFDSESSQNFSKFMSVAHQRKQPIIPVVIDSFGGSIYDLMAVISEIKNSIIPVATIVESKAMSAGCILFSCGTEGHRYMAPDATLMIHEAATGTWGKNQDVQADAKELERLNRIIFHLLASNCGKEPNYFLDLMYKGKRNADWYLTAADAKKHNLANHIKIPEFKTKIKVEYEFG